MSYVTRRSVSPPSSSRHARRIQRNLTHHHIRARLRKAVLDRQRRVPCRRPGSQRRHRPTALVPTARYRVPERGHHRDIKTHQKSSHAFPSPSIASRARARAMSHSARTSSLPLARARTTRCAPAPRVAPRVGADATVRVICRATATDIVGARDGDDVPTSCADARRRRARAPARGARGTSMTSRVVCMFGLFGLLTRIPGLVHPYRVTIGCIGRDGRRETCPR